VSLSHARGRRTLFMIAYRCVNVPLLLDANQLQNQGHDDGNGNPRVEVYGRKTQRRPNRDDILDRGATGSREAEPVNSQVSPWLSMPMRFMPSATVITDEKSKVG